MSLTNMQNFSKTRNVFYYLPSKEIAAHLRVGAAYGPEAIVHDRHGMGARLRRCLNTCEIASTKLDNMRKDW